MNILNVLRFTPDSGGGIAQHLKSLGTVAITSGHKLFLGFAEKRDWHKELENVAKIIIIPQIENPIRSGFASVLRKICRQYKIDVIHFHFYFSLPFSLALSFYQFNLPIIQHWHNPPVALNNVLTSSDSFNGRLKKLVSGLVAKITDRRIIDRHISVSNEISNQLIQNKWTTKNKILFFPNGVTIKFPSLISKSEVRSKFPVIGAVSNFRPQKAHATLVQAFSILFRKNVDSELWIVGEGSTKQKIEVLTKELGIESRVRFFGSVKNPAELYRLFDIFVLSTHYEGHPLVLLEAMSYGLPVVATRISSVPEMIIDGKNGLLVNPRDPKDLANALQRLIESKDLRIKIGEAGRKYVEQQLNTDDWANKLISLYEKCIKEKKRN